MNGTADYNGNPLHGDNGELADSQERALANLTGRHTRRARAEAERIREHAGWLIRDLDAGQLPSHRARGLLASAQEITVRLSALDAIGEATGILVTAAGRADAATLADLPAEGEGGS